MVVVSFMSDGNKAPPAGRSRFEGAARSWDRKDSKAAQQLLRVVTDRRRGVGARQRLECTARSHLVAGLDQRGCEVEPNLCVGRCQIRGESEKLETTLDVSRLHERPAERIDHVRIERRLTIRP